MHLNDSGFLAEDSEHKYKSEGPMSDQDSLSSYSNYGDNSPDDDPIHHYDYDASYDFDHDDYVDDIHLEPRPTHKPKSTRRKNKPLQPQPSGTKIILPLKKCPRPLSFPCEILEVVCTYLSQATLRHSVSLVSKEWNRVCNRYIRRVGTWKPLGEDLQQQLLDQIPKLTTLDIWYDTDPDIRKCYMGPITAKDKRKAWGFFQAAITAPFESQPQDELAPKCLLHHIQHLEFHGTTLQYKTVIAPLEHCFQFLLTLTLDIQGNEVLVPLFQLLDKSPTLLELYIMVKGYRPYTMILSGDADDHIVDLPEPPINPETAHFPRKPKKVIPLATYPDQYRLRVFECTGAIIRPRVLERIITTCPNLRVFRASDYYIKRQYSREFVAPLDSVRLMEHAKERCPKLERYTVFSKSAAYHQFQRIPMNFPETKIVTLANHSSSFEFFRQPTTYPFLRQITVLELGGLGWDHSKLINAILCLTPHLLHMVVNEAPQFNTGTLHFPDRYDELFKQGFRFKRFKRAEKRRQQQAARTRAQAVLPSSSTTDSALYTPIPKVWQCRDLRTLDLGYPTIEQDAFKLWTFGTYVSQNGLFKKLTSLKLATMRLRIGQRQSFPKQASALGQNSNERFPDDLAPLKELFSLELLRICAKVFPGYITPSDFEFLRPRSTETVVFFLENNKCKGNEGDQHMDETVWPRLQAFHIWYYNGDPVLSIKDAQAIRPGVELRVKQIFEH